MVEGNVLLKTIVIKDNKWQLSLRGQEVAISGKFEPDVHCLIRIRDTVRNVKMCEGIAEIKEKYDETFCVQETICTLGKENSARVVYRSKHCEQVTSWTARKSACRRCQVDSTRRTSVESSENKLLIDGTNTKQDDCDDGCIELDETDNEDMITILKNLFTNATEEHKTLLVDQYKAINCLDRRGMRWSKGVISTCLSLYVRSRKQYNDLIDSSMFPLPSGRQLK